MENITQPDPKKVFIIHGRNIAAKHAVSHFLRAISLEPIEFDALASTLGTSHILDIVMSGIAHAQAIVVLFTPGELAFLDPTLQSKTTEDVRWQSRPNVVFEAGLAIALAPKRTILVLLGENVSLFSDVDGIHYLRLNNTVEKRGVFLQKLTGAGCPVVQNSLAWTDAEQSGDFVRCVEKLPEVSPRSPFRSQHRDSQK